MVSAAATVLALSWWDWAMELRVSPRELWFLCPPLTTKVLAAEEVTQQWSRAQDTSASPSLNGQGDSSGSCAQSWLCGQWAAPPSGGLAQQHCLLSPATALGWGAHLPQLAHLSSLGRPLAVQEQSRLWEGVPWVKMSGILPAASSFAPHSATQKSHWATERQGLILLIKFLWRFSKPLFCDSHCHGLPSDPQGRLGPHWDMAWANIPLTKHSTNQRESWAGLALSVPTQWAALLFCSSALSFPHIFSINTYQPLRFCEITLLSRLGGALGPVPGKCCRNVKHPYGWPYHWERNLKSDLFVWLPESHCCIIHDSLLFFRRLILLPSLPPPPYSIHNMNFIFWTKPHSPL